MTTNSDDRSGLSQHTTIVRTEGAPMRVTVEFGARPGGCDILKWLSTSGVWAKLRPNEQAVLFVLLASSGAEGVVRADIGELEQGSGLGKSSVYAAIKGLKEHSAGLLEERDGGYLVLPGKSRQGLEREQRSQPAQAEPASPSVSVDKPERAIPRVLAPVQNPGKPSKNVESSAPQRAQFTNQPTNNTENSISVFEVVGWETIMKSAAFQFSGTPAELLRRLGMAGQLLETVKSYSGLSVDEILACAKGVASDSRVRNLAGVLAHRLACPRGLEQELKRAASGLSIKPDLLAFQQHIQLLRMRRRLG